MSLWANYSSFRSSLLKEAKNNTHIQQLNISHPLKGPHNEDLYIDILYRIQNPELPTFLLISGTHGVEGYFGSLCQKEFLKSHLSHATQWNWIIVHALNPYGMAWYRRTNDQNVDLNRNSRADFKENNHQFTKLLPFLKNSQWLQIIKPFIQLGPRGLTQAMAMGQYTYPDQIFYGGAAAQWELTALKKILSQITPPGSDVFVADLHTGLGPNAYQSLIFEFPDKKQQIQKLQKQLQKKLVIPLSQPGFYQATGTLSQFTQALFSQQECLHLTFEIGTHHFLRVLSALMSSNKHYTQYQSFSPSEAQKSLNAFFPKDRTWQKTVVSDFLKVSQLLLQE